jgi:LmbE family N-acetylglucosaminyl deacetylase
MTIRRKSLGVFLLLMAALAAGWLVREFPSSTSLEGDPAFKGGTRRTDNGNKPLGILAGAIALQPDSRQGGAVIHCVCLDDHEGKDRPAVVRSDSQGYFTIGGLKAGARYHLIARVKHDGKTFVGSISTTPPHIRLLIHLSEEDQGEKKTAVVKKADATTAPSAIIPPNDGKLRIIAFGAHPDDCELKAGGVAAMWAAQGHHVKFVSVTNGDIGHWRMAGGPLALRRKAEVEKAAQILGIHTQVLDIHDGELEPNLANRKHITRLIRQWNADIVMSHRPNDYHPDHRYVGTLVQDAAFMVGVPFFCPDVAPLKKNPLFLFYSDRFERPNPFRADIAVNIDTVVEKKLAALDVLVSQFFEGGALGSADLLPKDEAGREKRLRDVRQGFMDRSMGVAKKYRAKLVDYYGQERGGKVQHAEAFEICEYGSQPNAAEIRRLFPFFGNRK